MGRPSRYEIKKFANNAFAVANKRILTEHAEKQQQVLREVRRTGNIGGYLPALIKWGAERLRETILAQADAYTEAFTESGVPSDAESEKALETSSLQFAAGTISNIRGQLDLTSKRTRKPMNGRAGSIGREIEKSRVSALAEGKLKLERQRIRTVAASTVKRTDVDQKSEVKEARSGSAGNSTPAMDSIEIEDSASKFGQAKQDARKMFDSIASEGLSACCDAASYRRWLDDAEVNARNSYLTHKDPAWDHVLPAMDLETGRKWLKPGEAKLLDEKQEYERNLKNLDAHSPARKQTWLERYARESLEERKAVSPSVSKTAEVTTPAGGGNASTYAVSRGLFGNSEPLPEAPEWVNAVVDRRPVFGLPPDQRKPIKAELLKAAARTWSSPNLQDSPNSMRQAFDRIAHILFESRNLTLERLEEILLLVFDAADRGGWLYLGPDTRAEFARQEGHDGVFWSDAEALFRAQLAEWKARLLEARPQSDSGNPSSKPADVPTAPKRSSSTDQQQVVAGAGDQPKTRSLSLRDARIHDIIGEMNFTTLRNAEIMKDRTLRKQLRPEFQLQRGGDDLKCCLDRIRRAKGYLMSRQVTEKRSRRK